MLYLIYTTEEEVIARADQEGKLLKFAHWTQGNGTRWLTAPQPTLEGNWALDVTNYELSDAEKTETVPSYNPVPNEEE
jgi:hypothetical protein